ncbi:MAG TPA: DNA primase [Limnochordia bacterium]|nr:DNA primase [Limnochordia bacterium]
MTSGPAQRPASDRTLIDDVRARTDIVAEIGRYVRLERTGSSFKGLCPFHAEKTPSFNVNPEKQMYKCFGCGAGGDVFSFLEQIEGSSFGEVLRRLAAQVGVELAEDPAQQAARAHRRRLVEVNEIALRHFAGNLRGEHGAAARRYLAQRKLTATDCNRFELGFALPRWDALLAALRAAGVAEDEAVEAGLLARKESRVHDRFSDRVMFPIRDHQGLLIGFGGRILQGDGVKYLNTPQTPLFSKGEQLYGAQLALPEIRRRKQAIVCEGYLDVIALHQAGFNWSVAALGTAFTKAQAALLAQMAEEVVLAFDADAAGAKAAERSFAILEESGLKVRIARLPAGHDPDTFVRAEGRTGFAALIEAAVQLGRFRVERALEGLDPNRIEQRIEAGRRVIAALAEVQSPLEREGYARWAANRLGLSAETLARELEAERSEKARRTNVGPVRHSFAPSRYTSKDSPLDKPTNPREGARPVPVRRRAARLGTETVERSLLRLLLDQPHEAAGVALELGSSPFVNPLHNALLDALINSPEAAPELVRRLRLDRLLPAGDVPTAVQSLYVRQLCDRFAAVRAQIDAWLEREDAARDTLDEFALAYARMRAEAARFDRRLVPWDRQEFDQWTAKGAPSRSRQPSRKGVE